MIAAIAVVAIAMGSAGAVVLWLASRPWVRAAGQGANRPRPVRATRVVLVGAGLALLATASIWLALELADPAGLVPQRPLLEQLLPLATALWLGGSLAVLPWQPAWVGSELRRVAVAVPIAGAVVLWVSSQLQPLTAVAVIAGAGLAGLLAMACWLMARALDRASGEREHSPGYVGHVVRRVSTRGG